MCTRCGGAKKRERGSRYSRAAQHAPARSPPPVMSPPPPPQRRRSLFGEAASIAGGVTVGTAAGHVAGEAITSLFSGRRREEVVHALPRDYDLGAAPSGPCAQEIKQFLDCATNAEDVSQCQAFNDALKRCKHQYGLQ